jgi:DNA-binding NtrC family response regulator/tetratricopeptide (TPR) repeat protein
MREVRRKGELLLVSPVDSFGWGVPTIATLRHCSLPWYDASGPPISLHALPLIEAGELGTRDRISLLGQFVAHQAFLQFAGIADAEFDVTEWAVIRKRGTDCRLIRVAARTIDPAAAPPTLSLAQTFADFVAAPPLPVFRQSWSRAEAVYAEADEILRLDASADLRWMRRSATGEIRAPGAEALRIFWSGPNGRHTCADPAAAESLALLSALEPSATLLTLSSAFPLHRYGALCALDPSLSGSDEPETAVAERIATRLAERRHVVFVGEYVDSASRRVIDIASSLGTANWVLVAAPGDCPKTRWFLLATRTAARRTVEERLETLGDPRPWLEQLVSSDRYSDFLTTGELPPDDVFSRLPEPKRSYIAVLALLGVRVSTEVSARFLNEFLFESSIDELCVPGVTHIEDGDFCFESEAIRAHCARHIAEPSRSALCRTAASAVDSERAAFLLIEAGDVAAGMARLESLQWKNSEEIVEKLRSLPASTLSPRLARVLAHAYVDSGRYRDASLLAPILEREEREFLLARCDRRAGDYDTALTRLDRLASPTFPAQILRCEILRVAARFGEAWVVLSNVTPATDEEFVHAAYETSLLGLEVDQAYDLAWTDRDHYLAARFLTYRALTDSDFASAEQLARDALRLARSPIERIDAWLDLVFATFSAGRWSETRTRALEALSVIEETQGDRAAAGILFTLTYLAADEGQWQSAESMLRRLRHYYTAVRDSSRLFELKVLDAHLMFSRGTFAEARRLAVEVLERPRLLPQVREAAALIIDEVHSIEHADASMRSTGGSGNRELSDRHRLLAARGGNRALLPVGVFNRALHEWQNGSKFEPPRVSSRSESLKLMRAAMAIGRGDVFEPLGVELGVKIVQQAALSDELETLRLAATGDYPFDKSLFGSIEWAYATRNRLGHWSLEGNSSVDPTRLDAILAAGESEWVRCSDRDLLFIRGSDRWSNPVRETIAAVFRTRAENQRLKRLVEPDEPLAAPAMSLHGMVGESRALQAVLHAIARVASRDVPVCILGESGTGKELVARAIHRGSARRQKPFIAVNCAALPENLIESELFGHVRGAFTGADRDRAGLIETTDGGSLFLDEIGEMPPIAQAKLLRFLQDGEFRRVGDNSNRSSDVRIISATNRRLEAAVDEGRFREDLYYRIRGVEIPIPPLRERGGDVLLLARHFLGAERAKHGAGPAELASEVESLFRSYRWPGNVRELQNAVRAAHAMAGDAREIGVDHLPERLRNVVPARALAGSYQDAVARFRRDLIERSLLEADGNQNRAAALLNMSRQALAYQIRELGILVRKPAPPM